MALVNIRDLKDKQPIQHTEIISQLVEKKGVSLIPPSHIAQYVSIPAISVGKFGSDAITSVASYSDQVTEQLKMCDIPDFQTKILDILAVAKGVKVPSNEKQGAFSKFVGNARYSRDKFISNFEGKFVLVTKGRTRLWLVASILFALVGFMIAWFLILRINF